jgi:hypothetical protein
MSKRQRDFHEFSVDLYPPQKHAYASPTPEHMMMPYYTTDILYSLFPSQLSTPTLPPLTFEQLDKLHKMLKNHHDHLNDPGYDACDDDDDFIDKFIDGMSHDDIDAFWQYVMF